MAYDYLRPVRDQLFLLPVSMRDWLAEGHLAWFVLDVVEKLDLGAFDRIHPNDGVGRPAHDPQMMCALLLYSYATGVRSSRRVEQACVTDAAFKVICGGLTPDHATIARFVCDQQGPLEDLFCQGLTLLQAAGLIDLSVLALDGTKIAAPAALDRNRDTRWIKQQIAQIMAQTSESEQAEQAAADPLPGLAPVAEISSPGGRLQRLEAALAVIERRQAELQADADKKADAAFQAAKEGRKLGGRKPKGPAAALARAKADHAATIEHAKRKHEAEGDEDLQRDVNEDPAVKQAAATLAEAENTAAQTPGKPLQANITDPESRIMKTRTGWVQGYNAQAIVTEQQIVIALEVSQNTNDVELYEPMSDQLEETLKQAGIDGRQIGLMLADAGYWSERNATIDGPDRLIATLKDYKQRRAARKLGTTTGEPPKDASVIEAMEHRLRTPEGAAAYGKRCHLIEPVFGNRKHNNSYRTFRRRGLAPAQAEWAFMHLTGNLLKLFCHQHAEAATVA